MSKIEWTEKTWNPTTGCTKVSAGCKNCYAEKMHKRLNAIGAKGYEKPFGDVVCHNDRLNIPLKRKKPTTYFVNSMSDLFQEGVSGDFIDQVFGIIKKTPQHRYQILTKNSDNFKNWVWSKGDWFVGVKNVFFGVSVENKKDGFPRIGDLKNAFLKSFVIDYSKRNRINFEPRLFLSIEPLLEDLGDIDLTDIDWVIVGGESGNKARKMKKEWVLNIKRQCQEQGVPFFFKQWGAYGEDGVKRSKKANGCLIDGVAYKAMP